MTLALSIVVAIVGVTVVASGLVLYHIRCRQENNYLLWAEDETDWR